jgi:hypothetical protein
MLLLFPYYLISFLDLKIIYRSVIHKGIDFVYDSATTMYIVDLQLLNQDDTTVIERFAECLKHLAKPEKHSSKTLPIVTLGK